MKLFSFLYNCFIFLFVIKVMNFFLFEDILIGKYFEICYVQNEMNDFDDVLYILKIF